MTKTSKRIKRHRMIRSKVYGTAHRPRLSVYRGNKHLYVQLIDDSTGQTLLGMSDKKIGVSAGKERAVGLAKELASRAQEKQIKTVVFDRGGFMYHGQVKAIADTLREAGITV